MNLGDLLTGSNGWILLGVVTLMALLAIYLKRHSYFWLTDLSYTFPFVGRLRRYSGDYSKSNNPGWLNVENTLCRDYAKHMSTISRAHFENNIEYLRKSYDIGRKPMPMWIFGLIAVLVTLEGFGFSYLLGGFMAAESSENTRQLLMVGIVVVLAVLLLWLTHAAGHQLYRTNLLRDCFRQWQASGKPAFTSRIIKLNEHQIIDNDEPHFIQCPNRVATRPGDRGSRALLWIALAFIAFVAIGSTVLRIETLASTEAEAAEVGTQPLFGAAVAALPIDVTKAPGAAESARHNAALAGFMLLGVIFIVTQAVGMSVGYKYGFAGQQSHPAWKANRGQQDYHSYFEPVQSMMDIAGLRLNRLHQMLEAGSPIPLEFPKTFLNFISEERERGGLNLHLPPAPPNYDAPDITGHESEPKTSLATNPRMSLVSETQSDFEGKPPGDSPAIA